MHYDYWASVWLLIALSVIFGGTQFLPGDALPEKSEILIWLSSSSSSKIAEWFDLLHDISANELFIFPFTP
jgi:hypothetical protein